MPKYKELKEVPVRVEYMEALEKELDEFFKKEVFGPLMSEMGKTSAVENAEGDDPLDKAIRSGRVQYFAGVFRGRMSAQIAKRIGEIGGKWDRRVQGFRIDQRKLSGSTKRAIAYADRAAKDLATRLTDGLKRLSPEALLGKLNVAKIYKTTLTKLNRDFKSSVKAIGIVPKWTKEEQFEIVKEYTKNMEKNIKDFFDEEIIQLRKRVQRHTEKGARYEDFAKSIQKSYGVSKSKAHFWARQETHLLVSQYTKLRYTDAGVEKYRWRNAHGSTAHPVRKEHKKLNNTVQRWDSPPVTSKDGRRNHPGEDFNCRCRAIPVVEF